LVVSRVKQRKSQAGQAMADRSIVLNEIRTEVSTSRAKALALRSQVAVARYGLKTAEDGFRQDKIRLRESLSLPIEALDSLRLLSDARVALIEAITRANRTQFALFVSLGAPPPLNAVAPIPPQPVLPVLPAPVGGGD
jgi:outer membrane protein TolC